MAQMGASARIGRLRAVVGHEVLHLPSVSVIPVYDAGRVLLVRHAGLHDGWGQSLAVPSEWASHQQIQP